MKAEYRLLQYFANPLRAEARNVAVVIFNGKEAAFQAVGLQAFDRVNTEYFESIAKDHRRDAWVWAEWVEWLRTLTANPDADQIREVMDRLQIRNPQFVGHVGGFINTEAGVSLVGVANDLFRDMVGNPKIAPSDRFTLAVDSFFKESGLSARPDFRRDVEVTLDVEGKNAPVILDFAALLTAEPRIGVKCIQFRHHTTLAATSQVNDARFTFERVMDIGFIGQGRSIVLHDTPSKLRWPLLDRLKDIGRLVNIEDTSAPQKLREALGV